MTQNSAGLRVVDAEIANPQCVGPSTPLFSAAPQAGKTPKGLMLSGLESKSALGKAKRVQRTACSDGDVLLAIHSKGHG